MLGSLPWLSICLPRVPHKCCVSEVVSRACRRRCVCRGVPNVTVQRHLGGSQHPRAIGFTARTLARAEWDCHTRFSRCASRARAVLRADPSLISRVFAPRPRRRVLLLRFPGSFGWLRLTAGALIVRYIVGLRMLRAFGGRQADRIMVFRFRTLFPKRSTGGPGTETDRFLAFGGPPGLFLAAALSFTLAMVNS